MTTGNKTTLKGIKYIEMTKEDRFDKTAAYAIVR
jgi:hypothetical protein